MARVVGYAVPCPGRILVGLRATPPAFEGIPRRCRLAIVSLPCPAPWRGWVFGSSEGGAPGYPDQHLVIAASPRPIRDYAKVVNGPGWYPGARVKVGGWTRIRGWRARWIFVPPATNAGSAFSGHIVLVWTLGGHTYAVGFHDANATKHLTRRLDVELVEHLRLVPP